MVVAVVLSLDAGEQDYPEEQGAGEDRQEPGPMIASCIPVVGGHRNPFYRPPEQGARDGVFPSGLPADVIK
jgi:hypothetical protein